MANNELIITQRSDIVAIADVVRSHTGETRQITLGEIIDGIDVIASTGGGVDTSDATASADEIMSGETAYVNGSKVTGTFTIDNELSTQDDLISQIQSVIDNLPEAGGEPVLQTKTVTPTTSSQNVVADSGYDGLSKVTVNGDANLVAENIAEGVSIFGVAGTHSGGGSGSGSGSNTVSVMINNQTMSNINYWDANGVQQSAFPYSSMTVNALNGVLYYKQEMNTTCIGDYVNGAVSGFVVAVFLSDGGVMTCTGNSGSGAGDSD